jgi:hypothetical protein
MKVEIELTKLEELYIKQCDLKRLANDVLSKVPSDFEFAPDLIDLSEILGPVLLKLQGRKGE